MTGLHRERALKWADLLFKAVILGLLIALALLLPRNAKPAAASASQILTAMAAGSGPVEPVAAHQGTVL